MSDRYIGSIAVELQGQVGPTWHLPDEVRVGVLAGIEEYETWLQAHFLRCQGCRQPIIALVMKREAVDIKRPPEVTCTAARADLFRYLEGGEKPGDAAFAHIVSCDLCDDLFFEPAKNLVLLEYDPDETGEAG